MIDYQFGSAVAEAVAAVTRGAGEKYSEFVERAARHPVGRAVKLADVLDNLVSVDEFRPSLRKRYERALAVLADE